MGRDATKAAGNPWYQARKKAAEYDDRLCSRESAAEQLGMSVSSLADAELGNTKFMPVDKAVLMADRYNAPWLLNHYCLNECPIGCRHSLSDEVVGIDRVTVKLLKSLKTEKLGDVKDTLLDIAADGKITEDEKPALQEVLAYLDDLAKTVSELKTIGEMALNEDGDAHSYNAEFADIANGFSFVGLARDIMTKGCACCGLVWSLQNGVMQVKKPGDVMSREVFVLSEDSGLLGIPARVTEANSETSDKTSIGWEVEFFLNGAIHIDDYVKLESKTVTGYFRVAKLTQAGDNVSGDWTCTARLMEVQG